MGTDRLPPKPATVSASERQLRAGARVLRSLMAHPHPMVARSIRESLSDLTWNDLLQFTERCEAALLRPPEPVNARVHAADPRD